MGVGKECGLVGVALAALRAADKFRMESRGELRRGILLAGEENNRCNRENRRGSDQESGLEGATF